MWEGVEAEESSSRPVHHAMHAMEPRHLANVAAPLVACTRILAHTTLPCASNRRTRAMRQWIFSVPATVIMSE